MGKNIISYIVIGAVLIGLVLLGVLTSDKKEEINNESADSVSEIIDTSESVLKELSGSEVNDFINGEELSILYLMQTDCSYCELFTPVMNKIASEYDIDIYYIDLASMSETDDQTAFYDSHDFMNSQFGTPTTLIVKDGGIYGIISGYVEEASAISVFKKHGLIN